MRKPSCGVSFSKSIGAANSRLIRIIVSEYSAATEDFQTLAHQRLKSSHLFQFLETFGISLEDLHMLAVSIRPYDGDEVDFPRKNQIAMPPKDLWINQRNMELDALVNDLVSREKEFRRVGFCDVEKRICFDWVTPWRTRHWMVYRKLLERGTPGWRLILSASSSPNSNSFLEWSSSKPIRLPFQRTHSI